MNDYIVPCYDALHTFSKDYLVEELTEVLRERGEGVADMHCRSDEYLADELMMEYQEKENN